jgi:hypothetical protein
MTMRVCLRCDWEDDTRNAKCPNCGISLYVVGAPTSSAAVTPAGDDRQERVDDPVDMEPVVTSDTPPPRSDPPSSGTDARGPSGRSGRSAAAFVVGALVLVVAMVSQFDATGDRSAPAASPDAAQETPGGDGSPSPVALPSAASSGFIEPVPPARSELVVGGVPFSFRLPARSRGWERFGDISINKSIVGSQGAEAIIFWTTFPDGDIAEPCAVLLDPRDGRSAADLAAAVATAPGVELVSGPSDVTLDGRAAEHAVLIVRERVGCDPGFFFSWEDVYAGAFWRGTPIGSTIRAWAVDVDGTIVFIGAATSKLADADLEREVEQIVGSIRIDV